MGESADKIGAVVTDAAKSVPESFFDLISRVVPGAVIVAAYCVTYQTGPDIAEWYNAVMMLGASYLVGLTLSALGNSVLRRAELWYCRAVLKRKDTGYLTKLSQRYDTKNNRDAIDAMVADFGASCPEEHSILTKIHAEQSCFRNLAVGLVCLVLWVDIEKRVSDTPPVITSIVTWWQFAIILTVLVCCWLNRVGRAIAKAHFWYQRTLAVRNK